jgi:hypothetical protein
MVATKTADLENATRFSFYEVIHRFIILFYFTSYFIFQEIAREFPEEKSSLAPKGNIEAREKRNRFVGLPDLIFANPRALSLLKADRPRLILPREVCERTQLGTKTKKIALCFSFRGPHLMFVPVFPLQTAGRFPVFAWTYTYIRTFAYA